MVSFWVMTEQNKTKKFNLNIPLRTPLKGLILLDRYNNYLT